MLSMTRIVDFFDRYTLELGWQIIPVYARSKIPIGVGWNGKYNLGRARNYVLAHPHINLGLLLGDLVDVEGDTPQANDFLNKILDGYIHPMYESNKSIHHIFRSPDNRLTALKHDGVEFRGHKHYSVLPPSIHAGGIAYKWLTEPGKCIPSMPDELLAFYEKNKKWHGRRALRCSFVAPLCARCGRQQPIHRKRYMLEVEAFRQCGQCWECHDCRKVDVRELCRQIRKSSRRS